MTGRVVAVCVGRAQPVTYSSLGRSAIDKRPVRGRVMANELGLIGDEQADRRSHGGPDQALYAYADYDADHWAAELQRDTPPGVFGENLRLRDVPVSDAVVGTRWQVGEVLVEVTAPRIPCRTFAGFWDVPDLVKRFLAADRPGAYLRVLEPGRISAGDDVEVVDVPDHDVTVAEVARIVTYETDRYARLLDLDALAAAPRKWAEGRAARAAPQ